MSRRPTLDSTESGTTAHELSELRRRIDGIDDRLLALLAERLEIAREMARLKRRIGDLRRDPAREAQIIARLADGPLDGTIIEPIWQALLAASRRMQGCDD